MLEPEEEGRELGVGAGGGVGVSEDEGEGLRGVVWVLRGGLVTGCHSSRLIPRS